MDEGIASITVEVTALLSEHHRRHLRAMESQFTEKDKWREGRDVSLKSTSEKILYFFFQLILSIPLPCFMIENNFNWQ